MLNYSRTIITIFLVMAGGSALVSCRKMVAIDEPINSITTTQMFTTDAQAATAMAGVYTTMANAPLSFSNGYTTLLAGMSSDDLFYYGTGDAHILSFTPNRLLFSNSYTATVWTSAYKTIYNANSVIEGIAGSSSATLTDSTRNRLTAEAKFVRAFCYFYLTNFFGDVPLALTVDFNKTQYMARTPSATVYRQIIQDLEDVRTVLSAGYPTPGGTERIVPNKWAATALLARVYLYTGDNAHAAALAGDVIANTSVYKLETDPNKVFLAGSKEAIWQLKQSVTDPFIMNCTMEGYTVLPNPLNTGKTSYCLTASLLNAFEPGDLRRSAWVNSTTNTSSGLYYYPFKYKTGTYNAAGSAPATEYYMVLRLAEMYLVRAEAEANGATGGITAAIADLNVLRSRAGITALPASLTAAQVTAAVAHERQTELFAEWGHRWFDLKRTGQAHNVLSAMAGKQPWAGDYQLLYPIPLSEIQADPLLQQTPGY